ncbi:MAG: Phosphoglycerate transport regulatory protein PgtC precursor [Planctomycetota bacterium]
MNPSRFILPFLLVALAVLPLVVAPRVGGEGRDAGQVIIYTPHNEQIRYEFGRAFSEWHRREYGESAEVVWNTPGGTSEIRKILEANAEAAIREGRPVGGNADLVFGGGSYEYGQLKREVSVEVGGEKRVGRILERVPFEPAWLAETYGENSVGGDPIYDPEGYWFGAALSGFGIVYNRDYLADLGIPEPERWEDLADARLAGAITLVNPSQSGSVTTALEAIIQRLGWERGWQIIQRMSANARSVASSAPKVPLDVSAGDSAAGPSIDFYGRYQAQAVLDAGGGGRIGYIDPRGETVIDPDPIALLANAPNRALAERFIRFALSDHGQALWQFRAEPRAEGELGPERFELRRMPVRRDFRERYRERFIDDVDPFALASKVDDPDRNARSFIAPIFSAMCADRRDELARAWRAIRTHPAYPSGRALVTATDVDDPTLRAMLERFDAMPRVPGPEGTAFDIETREGRTELRNGWLKEKWKDAGLWPVGASGADELRRLLGRHYSASYREIIRLGAESGE